MIATATKTVVATVPVVGSAPLGLVAIAPDGKHAYVPSEFLGNVSVIDTATNTVVAKVSVVGLPRGIAVTPDGRHVYTANQFPNNVSVIDTATNAVVATVGVGSNPVCVGIVQPPTSVVFLAFRAKLEIDVNPDNPNRGTMEANDRFTLSSASGRIHLATDPVTFAAGPFSFTIPPGSFTPDDERDSFTFKGVIGNKEVEALISATGTLRYAFQAGVEGVKVSRFTNPVPVSLTIGRNSGMASVNATFGHGGNSN